MLRKAFQFLRSDLGIHLDDGAALESPATTSYNRTMSMDTEELIRICESLPEDKRAEVADFARFLLSREDDASWERLIALSERRPKLDAFLRQSAAELSTPMDFDRL